MSQAKLGRIATTTRSNYLSKDNLNALLLQPCEMRLCEVAQMEEFKANGYAANDVSMYSADTVLCEAQQQAGSSACPSPEDMMAGIDNGKKKKKKGAPSKTGSSKVSRVRWLQGWASRVVDEHLFVTTANRNHDWSFLSFLEN